jgi:hypothetical protein
MSISLALPSGREASTDRPLQRLAGAVLIQALDDACRGPRRYREQALAWFDGGEGGGFTFEFCCSLLDREPDDVRQRLERRNIIPRQRRGEKPPSDSSWKLDLAS